MSAPLRLPGAVVDVPAGVRGFDRNRPLSADECRAFHARGYRFVARYVGRRAMKPHDLTRAEAERILVAGLALHVVQHVEADAPPGWHPTGPLGTEYGLNAAGFAHAIGVPPGVCVSCDLEMVHASVPAAAVIAYANAWHDAVLAGGYLPCLYVGWQPGLSASQLYRRLRFTRYWGALNVNADMAPAPRGWCVKQIPGTVGPEHRVPAREAEHQDDLARVDGHGDQLRCLAPEGWHTLAARPMVSAA